MHSHEDRRSEPGKCHCRCEPLGFPWPGGQEKGYRWLGLDDSWVGSERRENRLAFPMEFWNIGANWNLDMGFERVRSIRVVLRQATSDLHGLPADTRVVP